MSPHLLDGGGVGSGTGGSSAVKALTGPQSTAYAAATSIPAGSRTSTQQQIVDDGDAARDMVSAQWNATQAALAVDIAEFVTEMQLELQRAIRKATGRGKTLNEQALSEMFAVVTYRVGQAIRLLFETKQLVGSGSGGYSTIQDEGGSLAQRTILDFAGAGVTATDSGAKTVVTIPGGSGGYSLIEDEGTPLTARTTLGFTGAGVSVADTGGETVVTIPGGGGVSATTVEVNVGASAVRRGSFTITDAAISGSSKLLVWQAPGPYTGKGTLADEAEMDRVSVLSVVPGSGSAVAKWEVAGGAFPFFERPGGNTVRTSVSALAPPQDDPQARMTARAAGYVKGNIKFTYVVLS